MLKGRPGERPGKFEVPRWGPALGAPVCAGLVVVRVPTGDWRAPALAIGLLLGIVAIYALMRPEVTQPLEGAPGSAGCGLKIAWAARARAEHGDGKLNDVRRFADPDKSSFRKHLAGQRRCETIFLQSYRLIKKEKSLSASCHCRSTGSHSRLSCHIACGLPKHCHTLIGKGRRDS